jgi:hypothetical protein
MATKAQDSIYDTYQAVCKRMNDIDISYRNRSDHLVLADLREGKAVIVARGFKAFDKDWQPGEEFTCDMMNIGRLSFIMESNGRILITKQEYTDRQEWQSLKPVRETLAPMVAKATDHQKEISQARGQAEAAEQAARIARSELEAATSNLARVERETAAYIAGLNLDI